MLTCIAVLLICYIQIKEIYLFSFKKFVCIIKFHIFVELKILLKSLLISVVFQKVCLEEILKKDQPKF